MLQFPRWRVDVTVGGNLVKTLYETATTAAAAIGKAKHKMRGAVSSAGAFKFKAARVETENAHATKKSPAQLQREIDETLTRATKKRSSRPSVVGSHGLGTADIRTEQGAYWIVTKPKGYRVDYKPWGPSNQINLGLFPSRRRAHEKVAEHALSIGATIA